MEIIKTQLKIKINGELKDVEIENGEITIIQPNKKDTGWENAESNYCIDTVGKVFKSIDCLDKARYDNANLFANTQLAENISRMQTLQRKMFRWQAENDEPIKPDAAKAKYYIMYNFEDKEFNVGCTYTKLFTSLPYFSSRQKALKCIHTFKDELIWFFTEFQWRMDYDNNSISCKESSVNQND